MKGPLGWLTEVLPLKTTGRHDMSTVELTADNFESTVGSDGIVLVDWWATWCPPCRQFAPVFEEASVKHEDITFGKIDTDAQQQLSAMANIQSIPTLMAFRDGILVFNQAGALPAPALEQIVQAVRDLDMDDVRRQIAAAEAAEVSPN
jgi:thioredoxin 1